MAEPALHVTLNPLTVTGSDFRAGEGVTVIANVPPEMPTKQAVASEDGSFVVDFPRVHGVPQGLCVRAMGSEGSVAIYARRAAQPHRPPIDQE